MKKNRWTLIFGIVILCIGFSLIIPCIANAEQKGEVVIVANNSTFGMRGADPHTAGGTVGMPIVDALYDGLVQYASDGKHHPNLAKSWKIEPDWKYITFNLDENARWTDGKPVTAADVKYSFERAMRKENELKFVWRSEFRRKVDRVEIIDDHTARVHLKSPYPALMDRASYAFVIVPKHYVEKLGDAEFSKKPMGSGPFRLESMKQDVFAVMVAKEKHHRKAPSIKNLVVKYVVEKMTRFAMLQTGEADIIRLAPEHVPLVKNNPNLRMELSKNAYIRTLVFFALEKPDEPNPLLDIRVRKAIAYSIDYETITKKIFHGTASPTWNIVAPYHPGYDPSKKHHPYDPEKARKLLAEAGYSKGVDLVLNTSQNYKLDAELVQVSASKVGINIKLEIIEHGTWRKYLQSKKLKQMGTHPTPFWNGRRHPSTALASTFDTGSKYTYHNNKELENEWAKLSSMIDEEELAKQVRLLTKLYHEKMLRINLWAVHIPFGISKKIKSWKNSPGRSTILNMEYVTLNN